MSRRETLRPVIDDEPAKNGGASIDAAPVWVVDAPAYVPLSQEEFDKFVRGERDMGDFPFYADELRQIRQAYDPDGIDALATSMKRPDGEPPYIWQINPIQVNEFDDEEALQRYLDDYRQFYGIDDLVGVNGLHRRPDGTWWVLIAGHRRNRAMNAVARQHDYTLKGDDVKTDVYKNMPFDEAIAMQGRENEHARVSSEDAAEDIKRHYDFYVWKNQGAIPTYVEIARISGYTPARVSDALRYCGLPPEVKREYTSGMIQYAMAVRCSTLLDAYSDLYLAKHPDVYGVHVAGGSERLAIDTRDAVLAVINHLKSAHLARMSGARKMEILEEKIRSVKHAATFVTDELFELSEAELPRERRSRSEKKLGMYAADVVLQRLRSGIELSPAELALLTEIVEEYQRQSSDGALGAVQESPEETAYDELLFAS